MTNKSTEPDTTLTFVRDAGSGTWAVRCDSDFCDGRELESGYLRLEWAVEEHEGHDCEAEAEAAYDRRYDMSWS